MYQVITLSAMGDAETPAGGSVCIRWREVNFITFVVVSKREICEAFQAADIRVISGGF